MKVDIETLQEGFGPASLQLEIIRTHVGTALLKNAAVVLWLANRKPDHLEQLQRLVATNSLPGHTSLQDQRAADA